MNTTHIPEFRHRFRSLVPLSVVLLVGSFVLYGFLGSGWWMFIVLPLLAAVAVTAAWRQASVRCPHCHKLVYEQEHHEIDRAMVFLCRRCEVRLTTDVPHPVS